MATNYVAQALGEAMSGKPVSRASTQAYGCSVKYPEWSLSASWLRRGLVWADRGGGDSWLLLADVVAAAESRELGVGASRCEPACSFGCWPCTQPPLVASMQPTAVS